MEQIFFNLFNNAITVMKDGGHLEISVKRQDTNSLLITFADNGPGIPQADLKHVFEPFFYTRAGESRTGLGLAVTYALVQEIGGQISVQSELGKGTHFHIRLPLKMERNDSKNTREYDYDG